MEYGIRFKSLGEKRGGTVGSVIQTRKSCFFAPDSGQVGVPGVNHGGVFTAAQCMFRNKHRSRSSMFID